MSKKTGGLEVSKPEDVIIEVCDNIGDKMIRITESKARLCYRDQINAVKRNEIFTDFGLALAFLTPTITADFGDIGFIDGKTIKALFIFATIIFICLTVKTMWRYFSKDKKYNEDYFIKTLKGMTVQDEDQEILNSASKIARSKGYKLFMKKEK